MLLTPSQGAILMMLGHDYPSFPETVRERMLRARWLLSELTGEDFGYDPKRWHERLSSTGADGYYHGNFHLKVPELIAEAQANPEWQKIRSQLQSGSSKRVKRPTSVSVIAWILIVSSIISLIATLVLIDNPIVIPKVMGLMAKSSLPISLQIVMECVGLLINLVAGNAMLNGRNWARFLYVVWRSIVFVIGILTSPVEIVMIAGQIAGFVAFAVVIFFCLFSPKANEYFSTKEAANNAQGV